MLYEIIAQIFTKENPPIVGFLVWVLIGLLLVFGSLAIIERYQEEECQKH